MEWPNTVTWARPMPVGSERKVDEGPIYLMVIDPSDYRVEDAALDVSCSSTAQEPAHGKGIMWWGLSLWSFASKGTDRAT
jgi:hypothetical protein